VPKDDNPRKGRGGGREKSSRRNTVAIAAKSDVDPVVNKRSLLKSFSAA